jgi:hypothetical protein
LLPETSSFYSILKSLDRDKTRNIGVLVYDASRGELWLRATTDYSFIEDDEEAEIMSQIVGGLADRVKEEHPLRLVEHLEDTLSNALLIGERHAISTPFTPTLLDELFKGVVAQK